MEGAVQRDSSHICRPDARRRVDEETTSDASQTVAQELDGERRRDLVAVVGGPRLVEKARQALDHVDVGG